MVAFMHFGDFAADAARSVRAEHLHKLLQRGSKPERRFVEYHSPFFLCETRKHGRSALLERKEALETEALARQSRRHERRDECRRSGKSTDFYPLAGTFAGKHEARVADAWRTGVAYQRDVMSFLEFCQDTLHTLVLIVLVMRREFGIDVVMTQQHPARPGVFSQDEIHAFKHLYGSESHIGKIANRRRDYVEDTAHIFMINRVCDGPPSSGDRPHQN